MTGPELAAAREGLGWSRVYLAEQLECSEGTIRQMEDGRRTIPPIVAAWITDLFLYHIDHPPPTGWRTQHFVVPAPRGKKPAGAPRIREREDSK